MRPGDRRHRRLSQGLTLFAKLRTRVAYPVGVGVPMNLILALALLLAPQSARPGAAQAMPAPVVPFQAASIQDEPLTVPAIVYPPEAKQARIQGTVDLEVTVDATGHVSSVRALRGPIPLRQAAIDAYTQATYKPILNSKTGRPTPAIVTTAVHFNLHELPPDTDQKVDALFEPLHARCQDLSRAHDASALGVCRQALDMSHRFTPQAQLDARASAVNDLVLLMLEAKNYVEAASTADEAVTLVLATNHPHTPAVATAYITRCEARSLAKDYTGAASDCAVAEETLQTLIADQSAPDESKLDRTANYKTQLRETLELHAICLDKSHHPVEARRIRNREKLV
jgi:TonB family protein